MVACLADQLVGSLVVLKVERLVAQKVVSLVGTKVE